MVDQSLPVASHNNKRMYCLVCKTEYPFETRLVKCCDVPLVKIDISKELS